MNTPQEVAIKAKEWEQSAIKLANKSNREAKQRKKWQEQHEGMLRRAGSDLEEFLDSELGQAGRRVLEAVDGSIGLATTNYHNYFIDGDGCQKQETFGSRIKISITPEAMIRIFHQERSDFNAKVRQEPAKILIQALISQIEEVANGHSRGGNI